MVSYRAVADDELNLLNTDAEYQVKVAKQALAVAEEDLRSLKDEKERRDFIKSTIDKINALFGDLCENLCKYDTVDLLNSYTGEVLASGLQNVPFDSDDATLVLSYRGGC